METHKTSDALYNLLEVKLENIAYDLLMSNTSLGDNLIKNVERIIEKTLINCAMKITKNNISKASRLLGINRNTLRKKIEELHFKEEKL